MAANQAPNAGALYDVINGERQYARVNGGKILSIGRYSAEAPEPEGGIQWLPIENEDSQSFDPEKHYREVPPTLRVDGSRVVRTYTVRDKRPDEIAWERQLIAGRA